MRLIRFTLATSLLIATYSVAHETKQIKQDIDRHRAMAAAHEAAAKCLESGKKDHDLCQKALQAACKGIAIGKYCGMKHEH